MKLYSTQKYLRMKNWRSEFLLVSNNNNNNITFIEDYANGHCRAQIQKDH